jgi:hypothetical protein
MYAGLFVLSRAVIPQGKLTKLCLYLYQILGPVFDHEPCSSTIKFVVEFAEKIFVYLV